jgi:hypothetical protein
MRDLGAAFLTIAVLALGVTNSGPAHAADGCKQDSRTCTEVGGVDDGFVAEGETRSPERPGSAGRPAGGPLPPTYVDRYYTPSCSGNGPGVTANTDLCAGATTACPDPELQYWVFEQTIVRATGQPTGPYVLADTVCLAPDAPQVDPLVAIPALVQRQFQDVVVLKGVPEVSPRPETLVNIPTVFETAADDAYQIPLTLLGQSVVITAAPERWTWTFGDGQTGSTTAKGSRGRVEHEYRTTGDLTAYVTITWSGTFSVNGGPSQPINGTATTTGEPVTVQVRQARSELVRD